MLTVFGSINIDQVFSVPSIPLPGETVVGQKLMETNGGKGANQAVAAARVANGAFSVRFICAMGEDDHASLALSNLKENGVAATSISQKDVATGTALIAIDKSGENAITVLSGANDRLTAEDFAPSFHDETKTLLCQGEVPIGETFAALSNFKMRKPDGLAILNLAPVPAALSRAELQTALSAIDLLVVNEKESEDVQSILEQDLPSIAASFSLRIVVTQGPKGALIYEADQNLLAIASPQIKPSDTTGAGDTFCGVLAAFLTEGLSLREASELACKAGAMACLSMGAQSGMPTRDALLSHSFPTATTAK
ncbi:PfkB family carbohydrate kinase [Notoacmeibacter sp. MSK16QG-6]|uniref:ribokinase n=1 Tax=Notoacmeibacter sp. MSK16QG-6 TaxID=2957982 RepID=UPI00209EB031|nr:ribokinase [Notoacmeibacter sp. MSK16QG-6]